MMKKLLYILCIWITCSLHSWGQITEAEYFFDTDPGVGSAIALSITAGNTINESFSMPVTGLADGVHVLHIRVKEGGSWSLYYRDYFYVLSDAIPETAEAKPIVAAEYFFDTDPGVGSATALSITAGNTIDENFNIPATGLADGVHVLQIRVKDGDNNWSLYYRDYFYVLDDEPAATEAKPIIAAEYFIDDDPGAGNGIALSVTSGYSIDESFNISIPSDTENGSYTLNIRVQDEDGNWSIYMGADFEVDDALSVDDFDDSEFSIFPNPTQSIVNINFKNNENYTLKVFDITGKQLLQKETSQLLNKVDLSNNASGIYVFKIMKNSTSSIKTVKIIKP